MKANSDPRARFVSPIHRFIKYSYIGKWRKSVFWPSGDLMLMKDSTAVSNQWCMPVNLLGGAILFDPWFTQCKVKGH